MSSGQVKSPTGSLRMTAAHPKKGGGHAGPAPLPASAPGGAPSPKPDASASRGPTPSSGGPQNPSATGLSLLELDKKPPPSPDDFFLEHQAAIARFDSRDQADLRNLLEVLGKDTGGGKLTDLLYKDLGTLAERLSGQTVNEGEPLFSEIVETLNSRLADPLAPQLEGKVDRARAMVDLISSLARPEGIIQGQGTATCAAAVVQTMLARKEPLEYAKLTTDLLFEGTAKPDGGGHMGLSTGELLDRELGKVTGRGPFNAIVQGSFMHFARELVPDDGTGTFEGGRKGAPALYGGGRNAKKPTYGGETDQLEGLTAEQVEALIERVMSGRAFQISVTKENQDMAFDSIVSTLEGRKADEGGRASLRERLEGAQREGQQRDSQEIAAPTKDVLAAYGKDVKKGNISGVPVGVRTDEGILHEILVLGVEQDQVIFQDPGDGMTKAVPVDKFKNDMQSIVVPNKPPGSFRRT